MSKPIDEAFVSTKEKSLVFFIEHSWMINLGRLIGMPDNNLHPNAMRAAPKTNLRWRSTKWIGVIS